MRGTDHTITCKTGRTVTTNPEKTDDFRKWALLIALGIGGGLILLDETVVGVALPSLQHDLSMSKTAAHWVVSSYMLVFAATATAAGKLGDIIGFRKLMSLGLILFGLTSLLAGSAENGTLLILARSLQGIGAAIIMPATVAMIMIAFEEERRGMALGILTAIGTCFLALGPLVGGFLTEILSWRWIFWINIPISLFILSIILWIWREPANTAQKATFDTGGFLTLVLALGLLIFAIMQGPSWGWSTAGILACLIIGTLLLLLFWILELGRASPLIDVRLFHFAPFSASVFVLFTGQFCKITIVVFGALFLQEKLAMSPFTAGLALLAAVAGFPVLSPLVGRLADTYAPRVLVLSGMTLATLAMFWIGVTLGGDRYLLILPGLILWGIGMPFCYAPTLRNIANTVPEDKQGEVGGIGVTARLLGGVFGMAVGSSLLLMTGGYQPVFLVTALLMLGAVLSVVLAFERQET